MYEMKTPLFALLLFCLTITACRKSADDCVVTNQEIAEIIAAQDAINEKGMIYFQNETPENCRAFQDAYQQYLDVAKLRVPCWIPSQREALRQGIADAEESLAELGCE